MKNTTKTRGAWAIIDVAMCEGISQVLSQVMGVVVDSNFISLGDIDIKVPVDSDVVVSGDRIKLVWFTSAGDLADFRNGKKDSFIDSGLRCFRLEDGAWSLLYEDFAFSS